jgi:hypothetical protein
MDLRLDQSGTVRLSQATARAHTPRTIDPRVPTIEPAPEPCTPRVWAETHLPPAWAAACARASVQMSEHPCLPCSTILQKNDPAQWKMAKHKKSVENGWAL